MLTVGLGGIPKRVILKFRLQITYVRVNPGHWTLYPQGLTNRENGEELRQEKDSALYRKKNEEEDMEDNIASPVLASQWRGL
ncbi:unnamed protein product [Cuscuta campestris]|uniref:Uncharacterized protein n=1 Tax=Cuscuta campestris TaxID=132261 RepID=A0A484N1Y2_9ASTE|nr:unnamed protein product [Cuscuta campestris]